MIQKEITKSNRGRAIYEKDKSERKQRILELHNEGMTPKEIAYEMGRSTSLIYNVLSELKAEGAITEEKLFEHVETRDAVIMYMLNRKYTDRDIGQFLGVSPNTIHSVRHRELLTDEELNKIIEEKSNEVELANARYIEKN